MGGGWGRAPNPPRGGLPPHYWEELSAGECAQVLGCSTGAVWVRLHRARAALREVLGEDQGGMA
ncbi:MAG: hypothetical protein LBR19_09515 [Bifidobacteriaceae bacterium]|nr:hypothetical protein [Bifidobacteriaceae bacterium]